MPNVHDDGEDFTPEVPGTFVRPGHPGDFNDPERWPDYPSPEDISYDEDSRWCQEHGHTGLLVGYVCEICDQLVRDDPRFAAALGTVHAPDGSRAGPVMKMVAVLHRHPFRVAAGLAVCGAAAMVLAVVLVIRLVVIPAGNALDQAPGQLVHAYQDYQNAVGQQFEQACEQTHGPDCQQYGTKP